MNKLIGHVKWFNQAKAYGFIMSGGQDYFVYFRDIEMDGFKTLAENERVEFEPSQTPKGWCAKHVRKYAL